MSESMGEYCAAMKGPVVDLMRAAFDIQLDAGQGQVIVRLVDDMLAAESLRPPASTPAESGWESRGVDTLRKIKAAAQAGDADLVWALFSDKEAGMFLLGNACQGHAGW